MKIKILNDDMINKIAAGEVVERPLSVLKELVENAIDAHATHLKISIVEAGFKEIRVVDNGIGMTLPELELAVKRHATSKITTDRDLFNIKTLGFRGEALPTIAAVSHFKIITSTPESGGMITINGGIEIEKIAKTSNIGCEVIVKNLFYNVPARLKHTGNPYYEAALITNYLNKVMITKPDLKIEYYLDHKHKTSSILSSNHQNNIALIYGHELAKNLIPIKATTQNFEINGLLASPSDTRANSTHITLVLNGRLIKNYELINALVKGYQGFLHGNHYPIALLQINCDHSLIDVNIHPSKQIVKISQSQELTNAIEQEVASAIRSISYIGSIHQDQDSLPKPTPINQPNLKPQKDKWEINDQSTNYSTIHAAPFVSNYTQIPPISIIGQYLGTYIVGQADSDLYLTDQHALQEKVNYEHLTKQFETKKWQNQSLIIAQTFRYNQSEIKILTQNKDYLTKQFGITFEPFGIDTIKIDSIPNWIPDQSTTDIIQSLLNLVIDQQKPSVNDILQKKIILKACKMSIKANHKLSHSEMSQLLADIDKCQNPFTCPHGRPIFVKLTKYEIEKLFKRA